MATQSKHFAVPNKDIGSFLEERKQKSQHSYMVMQKTILINFRTWLLVSGASWEQKKEG